MWQIVSLNNNLHEIKKTVIRNTKEKGKFWSGGYSDIVLIAPIENYCFNENSLPNIPYDVRFTMYIPMFDFDLIASGDPRKDLEEPVFLLAKNGFSGWLIQSGDEKKGSYHFLSNLLFPHDSSYWKIKAKLMKILTPNKPFFRYLLEFAERLEKTKNWEDARKVAREILYSDKGILSNFKTGSYIDYRFMAHSIEQRIGVLRSIKSYKYRSLPTVVGEIK